MFCAPDPGSAESPGKHIIFQADLSWFGEGFEPCRTCMSGKPKTNMSAIFRFRLVACMIAGPVPASKPSASEPSAMAATANIASTQQAAAGCLLQDRAPVVSAAVELSLQADAGSQSTSLSPMGLDAATRMLCHAPGQAAADVPEPAGPDHRSVSEPATSGTAPPALPLPESNIVTQQHTQPSASEGMPSHGSSGSIGQSQGLVEDLLHASQATASAVQPSADRSKTQPPAGEMPLQGNSRDGSQPFGTVQGNTQGPTAPLVGPYVRREHGGQSSAMSTAPATTNTPLPAATLTKSSLPGRLGTALDPGPDALLRADTVGVGGSPGADRGGSSQQIPATFESAARTGASDPAHGGRESCPVESPASGSLLRMPGLSGRRSDVHIAAASLAGFPSLATSSGCQGTPVATDPAFAMLQTPSRNAFQQRTPASAARSGGVNADFGFGPPAVSASPAAAGPFGRSATHKPSSGQSPFGGHYGQHGIMLPAGAAYPASMTQGAPLAAAPAIGLPSTTPFGFQMPSLARSQRHTSAMTASNADIAFAPAAVRSPSSAAPAFALPQTALSVLGTQLGAPTAASLLGLSQSRPATSGERPSGLPFPFSGATAASRAGFAPTPSSAVTLAGSVPSSSAFATQGAPLPPAFSFAQTQPTFAFGSFPAGAPTTAVPLAHLPHSPFQSSHTPFGTPHTSVTTGSGSDGTALAGSLGGGSAFRAVTSAASPSVGFWSAPFAPSRPSISPIGLTFGSASPAHNTGSAAALASASPLSGLPPASAGSGFANTPQPYGSGLGIAFGFGRDPALVAASTVATSSGWSQAAPGAFGTQRSTLPAASSFGSTMPAFGLGSAFAASGGIAFGTMSKSPRPAIPSLAAMPAGQAASAASSQPWPFQGQPDSPATGLMPRSPTIPGASLTSLPLTTPVSNSNRASAASNPGSATSLPLGIPDGAAQGPVSAVCESAAADGSVPRPSDQLPVIAQSRSVDNPAIATAAYSTALAEILDVHAPDPASAALQPGYSGSPAAEAPYQAQMQMQTPSLGSGSPLGIANLELWATQHGTPGAPDLQRRSVESGSEGPLASHVSTGTVGVPTAGDGQATSDLSLPHARPAGASAQGLPSADGLARAQQHSGLVAPVQHAPVHVSPLPVVLQPLEHGNLGVAVSTAAIAGSSSTAPVKDPSNFFAGKAISLQAYLNFSAGHVQYQQPSMPFRRM